MFKKFKSHFLFGVSCLTLFCSLPLFAKEIVLYDQPRSDAKIINKVDSNVGIIPIYTPKDNSGWLKIADPRNGNVGWIKMSDIKGANVAVMQKMIVAPGNQQVIQSNFGQAPVQAQPPRSLTPAERQAMLLNLQRQQQELQQSTQQLMQATIHYLNTMFQDQARLLSGVNVSYPSIPSNNPQVQCVNPGGCDGMFTPPTKIVPPASPLNPTPPKATIP